MDILKYLDVLIGLAVVMLLLSPLVSALTQFWIWLLTMRAGRLHFALKQLLLQLNGNPYERFEAVSLTGLMAGDTYQLGRVSATVPPSGPLVFANDIPALLRAGNGGLVFPNLRPALPGTAPSVTFRARGPVGDWQITSPPTGVNGVAVAKYLFPGPAQFASKHAAVTLPAGASLTAKIASGPFSGTPLEVTAGPAATITYPDNAQPMLASHDIELMLTNAGAPVANQQLTLTFERNGDFDAQASDPLAPSVPPAQLLTEAQAYAIARAALLHPMIAQPGFAFLGTLTFLRCVKLFDKLENRRRGEVIEREELTRVLLELAAGEGSGSSLLDAATRDALSRMLADNGIASPGGALAAIRDAAQYLEKTKPDAASHTRLSEAILQAAPSAFVGKINNWFDQAMDRTVSEYKFRAQLLTVVGALLVALAIQMDSIDLLKKLASDDKLRAALVDQAKEQQRRFEELAKAAANVPAEPKPPKPAQSKDAQSDAKEALLDEVQLAKVRREEIETNLAKLRDPSLAILPEHFIWQPLPEGYLIWTPDQPGDIAKLKRLELVAGASTYTIQPKWPADSPAGQPRTPDDQVALRLAAVRDAINNSGAPVTARLERPYKIVVSTSDKTSDIGTVRITVGGRSVLDIEDPPAEGTPRGRTGRVVVASLADAKDCILRVGNEPELPIGDCNVIKLVSELKNLKLEAVTRDALVLTSRRNPPLQLRQTAGHPESNMLESQVNWACPSLTVVPLSRWFGWSDLCFDLVMLKQSWLGVLVTWMLLSLGAPFWYDALKDMLKLRSTLASKEEAARNDRQRDTTKPASETGKAPTPK